MKVVQKELSLILERLKKLDLYKVILIGSFAYGHPDKDSDVDLIVVTNDEYFPKNYQEKSNLYLKISNTLTDIAGMIPIDLIVYTKSMYNRFIQVGSLFSKKVSQKGVILYETGNEGMAEQSRKVTLILKGRGVYV
ncbi:MAG TPA: nucleotidyltransferase domain-containing protein [Thermodesulfovibrionia bacterium]|nr:nucleotidyltransferase domain-containing protein [Thermodesulfovibrionia bacterium]